MFKFSSDYNISTVRGGMILTDDKILKNGRESTYGPCKNKLMKDDKHYIVNCYTIICAKTAMLIIENWYLKLKDFVHLSPIATDQDYDDVGHI